ncbi:MiaB/RimO family radical SAM methylthiotransferase [Candidatus Dojkabacteria bacterium]|nr:MiaB/RimO family radical SAM methylthiotransferase [Candidatus Dojkabacteria bacterium]
MQKLNPIKNFTIETFGCAMNIADSERFRTILRSFGLDEVDSREKADLIIFNTCSVRESAENRIYGLGPAIQNLKSINPGLKVILTGCMARREFSKTKNSQKHQKLVRSIKSRAPWLDLIIETTEFQNIGKELNKLGCKVKSDENKIFGIEKNEKMREADEFLDVRRTPITKTTAGITISHGCDHMCSYCIVPFARGREIARQFEPILKETKQAIASGSKDIVLLGQIVNRWINPKYADEYLNGRFVQTKIGNLNRMRKEKAIKEPKDFLQLLETLDKLDGDFWLSFMSSHPNYFTKELIDFIAESVKSKSGHMRPYIHLALQSGSNEILKRMRRNHQVEEFIENVKYMRDTIPEVAISTDIIVGFPGETEEQFIDTLNVCKQLEFDLIFISEYSERSGTGSANFKDDVPHDIKESRKNRLNKIITETALKNNKRLVGTKQKVIVTHKKRNSKSVYQGRTASNKLVQFSAKSAGLPEIGEFVNLEILSATPWSLEGRLI